MKRLYFLLLSLVLCVAAVAQSCYSGTRQRGITLYNQKKYQMAIKAFTAAKSCPDKPKANDLDSWIKKCRDKVGGARGDDPASGRPQAQGNNNGSNSNSGSSRSTVTPQTSQQRNQSSSSSTSYSSSGTAKVEAHAVAHNQSTSDGDGMRINAHVSTSGMKDRKIRVVAYFYDSNGTRLSDRNGKFALGGQVAGWAEFTPKSDSSTDVVEIKVPYSELHLTESGKQKIKFQLVVLDKSREPNKRLFTYSMNTTTVNP